MQSLTRTYSMTLKIFWDELHTKNNLDRRWNDSTEEILTIHKFIDRILCLQNKFKGIVVYERIKFDDPLLKWNLQKNETLIRTENNSFSSINFYCLYNQWGTIAKIFPDSLEAITPNKINDKNFNDFFFFTSMLVLALKNALGFLNFLDPHYKSRTVCIRVSIHH